MFLPDVASVEGFLTLIIYLISNSSQALIAAYIKGDDVARHVSVTEMDLCLESKVPWPDRTASFLIPRYHPFISRVRK